MPIARKMSGRKFGILGFGRIGQAIAERLRGFSPHIAYSDVAQKPVEFAFYADAPALAAAVDVLIIAVAASTSTNRLVNRKVLDALGPDGILVNISRGSVVDEPALITALHEGRLGGAALDVFENEPHVPEPLRDLPNVLLTPHIASATVETRQAMARVVLANLDAYLAGEKLPTALV
jgi:lactate dehydrogenase-like 2-hydroxyacid dehydrogenase